MLRKCTLLLLFMLLASPTHALQLARNLATSVRDMEYFYQHRHTDALRGILAAFEREKKFNQGEVRLTTAAFLSEIFRNDPEATRQILSSAEKASPNAQRMLVWAAHLSDIRSVKESVNRLAAAKDKTLLLQLAHSPSDLRDWDVTQSRAVLHMFWSAFFAYADERYLAAITDAALLHARLRHEGKISDPRFNGGREAAASLYEMAPRHEPVRLFLRRELQGLHGPEADTIRIILEQEQSGTRQ